MAEYYYSYEFEKLAEMEGVFVEYIEENFTAEEEHPFHKTKTTVIAFGTFLSAVGSFLNGIIIVALLKSGTTIKGTNRVLMGLLCFTYLLSLLFIVPFEVAREYQRKWPLGDVMCKVWTLTNHLTVPMTLWTCVAMILDRICYLRQFNHYMSCDRKYRIPSLLIGVLFLCVTSVAPLIGWLVTHDFILPDVCAIAVDPLYTPVLASLCYFLPAIICLLSLLALTILTKSKVHQLKTMDRQESWTALDPQLRMRSHAKGLSCDTGRRIVLMENTRQCITALSFLCVFFWAPFYVANLKITYCDSLCVDPRLWTLLLWLGYSSHLISPILFLVDNRIRGTVKSWVSKTSQGEMEFLNSRSSTTSDYSIKTDNS